MKSIMSNTQSKAALLTSASILLRQAGYTQKAIEVLQAAVSEEEGFAPAYTLLGAIDQELGHDEEAEKAYRQALKIEPDNNEALQGLGLFLRAKERFAEALPYLEKHYQKNPADLTTINGLLDCLEETPERESDFISTIKKAWEETKDSDLGIRYGRFLLYKGQTDEAINVLNSAVEIQKTVQAFLELAKIYYKRDEFDSALQNFKLATEIDANYHPAWKGLAQCYLALDQFDTAIEAIERAISLDPKNYHYWRIKAEAFIQSNQFELGLQATQNGLEIIRSLPEKEDDFADVLLYFQRFGILITLNRFEELLSEIQIALEEIPRATVFYHIPALRLLNRGQAHEALRVLNLVKDDEIDDQLLLLRFKTLMQLGEVQQAWELWELIIPRLGKDIALGALCEFVVQFYQQDLPDPAIEIYRKLRELDPNGIIRIANNLGYLLIEKGQFDEAKSLLLSVATYPEAELFGAIAQCNLAYLYNLTGDYEEALQACEFVLGSDHKDEEAYLRVSFWLNGKMRPDPDVVPGRRITLADAARACGAAAAMANNQLEIADRYVKELTANTKDEELAKLVKDCLLAAKGMTDPEDVMDKIKSKN
ncbi:MAG: tetratricopeptide repeat protein [Bellilinea sp.]